MNNENNLRGRGRPELAASDRRNIVTQFRCTKEERAKLEQAAKRDGKNLSDWMRENLLGKV